MAFTSADLTQVETAIVNLGIGERVVTVRFSSGKTIQYHETDLGELERLRGMIKKDINLTAGNSRYRYASTSKGY